MAVITILSCAPGIPFTVCGRVTVVLSYFHPVNVYPACGTGVGRSDVFIVRE